jgi:PAS domain S-box-containing protein
MSHDIFSSFSSEELQSALANKLLAGLLDTMPVAVAFLEANRDDRNEIVSFKYAFANTAADKLAGEPLAGKRLFLNDDALLFNNMAEVANSGQREDFLYHYQKEPEKWIHYSISRFDSGVMLTYENVTERKKAVIALQRERAQMAEAQAICNTGSFEWDLVNNKIYWSDEMYRIHKREPQSQEITPDIVFNDIHPDDLIRIRKKIEGYMKTPGREELLYKLRLPDGEIRHMRTRLESFRGKSGKITHISGMAQDITERKMAEEALRNVNDQLKRQSAVKEKREAMLEDYGRILSSVHDAIISIDAKGYIVTWNAGAEKMYGYSADEAIGRHVGKLIVPENKQTELLDIFARIFKNGESVVDFRTVKKNKDHEEFEVIVNIVPLKDVGGKVTGAAATSKKISDPETKAEDKYKVLIETIDEGFGVLELIRDDSGKAVNWIYHEVNESFLGLTGLNNPVGKTVIELIPDMEPYWFDHFAKVADTGEPIRLENYVKAVDKWYTLHASRIGEKGSQLVAIVFNDITALKTNENQAKIQITEQNKLIQSMTTATPDIMFVMDIATKNVLFATKNIAAVMGYNQAQIEQMNEPFFDIMHPDDRQLMLDHIDGIKTAADGEVREIQYRMLHADASTHWFVDRNVVFRRDEKGVPTEKMGITHDIDSRVTADEKIHMLNRSLTEKNRELRALNNELKTFTSVAAYDYKDTLQNLYTNLEFIIARDAQNLSNTGKANLRKAQTAIQKMKLLTDDIVEFSKIRTPDESASHVDLNDVVASALDELSEKIAAASPEIDKGKLPVIKGYPFLLDLLFYHLLDNAIKFRNPDEPLKITISHSMSKDKHTEQDVHAISIADNGIGLEQEEASKIFEMFYRVHGKKYRGSGIGLAICKKIADLHGGTMAIESEPGKGMTVCCFFPVT